MGMAYGVAIAHGEPAWPLVRVLSQNDQQVPECHFLLRQERAHLPVGDAFQRCEPGIAIPAGGREAKGVCEWQWRHEKMAMQPALAFVGQANQAWPIEKRERQCCLSRTQIRKGKLFEGLGTLSQFRPVLRPFSLLHGLQMFALPERRVFRNLCLRRSSA
ncbi:hypothetical protein ASG48_08445 [Aurantimonas sp. Leaf443]|nr:hypothetical protein ASG48_08445 [Aurantimonas sp. Leaf443]